MSLSAREQAAEDPTQDRFQAADAPGRRAEVPPIPDVPAEWTDPPMRELAAEKRRAVEAAPRDGTAWGELGMVFDAHERGAEAITCYRTAAELAPDDAR